MIGQSICLLVSMSVLSVAVPRMAPNTGAPAPVRVAIGPAAPVLPPHRVQFLYASAAWGSEVAQPRAGKPLDSDGPSNGNRQKRIAPGGLRH